MRSEMGISLYFRKNRIRLRNRTISELGNPEYVHLFVDSEDKIMYIQSCARDKDAFKLYYRAEKSNEEFYIYAKILMQYLATVIGVAQDSASLRFGGVMLDEQTVMIALDEYEEVNSD